LRYHEFTELHRFGQRVLNQTRIISNNIAIRRAAEALQSCQTLGDIGAIIEEYLEPVGFDGFALETDGLDEVPESALVPFTRNGDVIYLGLSEADAFALRLEFRLAPGIGHRKRSFSVFRVFCGDASWFDANLFVSSGFIAALDGALLLSLHGNYSLDFDNQPEKAAVVVAHSLAAD
jgi:hypothetical protein